MVGPLQRGGCATLLTFKLSLRVMNYDGKHGKCHFWKSAQLDVFVQLMSGIGACS